MDSPRQVVPGNAFQNILVTYVITGMEEAETEMYYFAIDHTNSNVYNRNDTFGNSSSGYYPGLYYVTEINSYHHIWSPSLVMFWADALPFPGIFWKPNNTREEFHYSLPLFFIE